MRYVVVSPHVDDAVFSLAETMMTWLDDGHDVTVLSVFDGIPHPGHEHHAKHVRLWEEHKSATSFLGVDYASMGLFDDAIVSPSSQRIEFPERGTDQAWVWPTGIRHPDHIDVRFAEWRQPGDLVYDEIPYYVQIPERVFRPPVGWPVFKRVGCRSYPYLKMAVARRYESQINDDLERCLLAPERVWRPL